MTASLYDLEAKDLDGASVPLSRYRGNVALVVNTASRCGFTPQYRKLEALYQAYQPRGFVVMAFPSNDFGGQEPGSNNEIKEICSLRFRLTFPVFEKAAVTGASKQPVYRFLTEQSDPQFHGDPGWNFVKFLVNRDGAVIGRFSALTSPSGGKIKRALEAALG